MRPRERVYGFICPLVQRKSIATGGIQFVTPVQRHTGMERSILMKRDAVYLAAKQRNPERWSRGTRNREPVGNVLAEPGKRRRRED